MRGKDRCKGRTDAREGQMRGRDILNLAEGGRKTGSAAGCAVIQRGESLLLSMSSDVWRRIPPWNGNAWPPCNPLAAAHQ